MPELEGAMGVMDAPAGAPSAPEPSQGGGEGAPASHDAPTDAAGTETDLSIETGAEQGADAARPEAAEEGKTPEQKAADAAKPTPAKPAIDPQLLKEALADPKFGPLVRTIDNQLRSFRGAFPTVAEAWAYKTEFPTLAEAKEAGQIYDEHTALIQNLKSGDPEILSKELDLLGEETPEAVSQLMEVSLDRAKSKDLDGYNRIATRIFNESLEYVVPNAQALLNSGRINKEQFDGIVEAANLLYGLQTGRSIGDPKPAKSEEELRIEKGRAALKEEAKKASDAKLNSLRDASVGIASKQLRAKVEGHLKKVLGGILSESGMKRALEEVSKRVETQTGQDQRFLMRFARAVREGKSPEDIAAICGARYATLLPKIFAEVVEQEKAAYKTSSGRAQARTSASQQPEMSGTPSTGVGKPKGPPTSEYLTKHNLWPYLTNAEINAGDYSRLERRVAAAKIPHW